MRIFLCRMLSFTVIAAISFHDFLREGSSNTILERWCRGTWGRGTRDFHLVGSPRSVARGGVTTLVAGQSGLGLAVEDIEDLGVFLLKEGGPRLHTLLVLDPCRFCGTSSDTHMDFAADVGVETVDQELKRFGGICLGAEADLIDPTGLGILHKGADKLGRKDSATAQRIDIGRPDGFHESTGIVSQGVTSLIRATVGGPICASEEFGEGANMAEGLESGVQITVVGDVAESAPMGCCWMHMMHRCCHTTYIAWRVGLHLY